MLTIDLSGKTALVTGGVSGIGLAISRKFAEAGARVVLADVNEAVLEQQTQELLNGGFTCVAATMDVTDAARVREVIDQYTPDILINSAGILTAGMMHEVTDSDWEKQFAVNVFGTANCSRAFLSERLGSGREGSLVCVSSVGGIVGDPGYAAYCASKGAVVTLVRQMAVDYAKSGIRVNGIAPGFTATKMSSVHSQHAIDVFTEAIPRGKWAEPEEIANGVLFLCSDLATHVHGQILAVDGGRLAGNPYPRLHGLSSEVG